MVRLWVFHMLLVSFQPGQPQQDLLQHRGVQLIEYEFSPAGIPDQVRLLQHRQVPGDGGGADRKVVRQFSGAFASVPQQLLYGPPGGVRQRPQRILQRHNEFLHHLTIN